VLLQLAAGKFPLQRDGHRLATLCGEDEAVFFSDLPSSFVTFQQILPGLIGKRALLFFRAVRGFSPDLR
jgi:hypothetical protein